LNSRRDRFFRFIRSTNVDHLSKVFRSGRRTLVESFRPLV
jgi:hypothetical protein